MILFFTVDRQIITRQDYESVVQDSQNYLYAQFSFSEEWGGTITAVFRGKDGQTFNVLLDESGKCLVPWEVLTQPWFEVSVFCGNLITANVVKVFTIASGYAIGEEGREPTPDVYSQIIEKINESEVTITPTLQSGTKIADITKGETTEPLYAPTGGGGTTPIISASATVDGNTGTPSVEVTKSGTDEAPSFAFAFSNLKGETGSQGPQGIQGPTGPQGPQGEAGADGSVVTVTQTLSSGTKIGSISVDGTETDLFAPEGIENVTENTELQIVDDNENVGVEIGSDDWENASFMEKYGFGGFPYGYENLPPKNKFSGLVEGDMFIVDGGKGRWNGIDTGNALYGGHLFEGWNAPHDARLTFGIGVKDKDVSFIVTFRPHSTSEQNDGYYGIVKIGDDREKAGTVFTNGLEKHNGLMCLATSIPNDTATATQRLATSGELAQTDYNSTDNIPYGAMYFDLTEQKVKVYTSSGWKPLNWEA